jgi:geranylgeranyl transferase type-2 subunit alpha
MHGRNRAEHVARMAQPAFTAALSKKVSNYSKLVAACETRMATFRASPDPVLSSEDAATTLELIGTVLSINQDYYTLWNFRRDIVANLLAQDSSSAAFPPELLEPELKLTELCLKKNPKSYPAFHHRKYILSSYLSTAPPNAQDTISAEFKLTVAFLAADERNFHCMNYRRFLLSCRVPVSADVFGAQLTTSYTSSDADSYEATIRGEFEFTKGMIEKNFSNGSAYHYRAKLLPLILALDDGEDKSSGDADLRRVVLCKEELGMVQEAYFVQPSDQSPWLYHRFILSYASVMTGEAKRRYAEMLMDETVALRELIEEEGSDSGGAKWALLALHDCLQRLNGIIGDGSLGDDALELLSALQVADEDKKERYEDMRRQKRISEAQVLFVYSAGEVGGGDVWVELKRPSMKKEDIAKYVSWFKVAGGRVDRLGFVSWDQATNVREFSEGTLSVAKDLSGGEWKDKGGEIAAIEKVGEVSEDVILKCLDCWDAV